MKTTLKLLTLSALAVTAMAGCTGDSVQPTAAGSAQNLVGANDPNQQQAQSRPIGEFMAAQGTWCADNGTGECMLYAKPVQNHIAFYDQEKNKTIMVDYAGTTNLFLSQTAGRDFGTVFNGLIREEPMPDGRVRVMVNMNVSRAIVYMLNGTDVMHSPTFLGTRPAELMDHNNQPSLADVELMLTYINAAPGLPVPDLMQLVRAPEPGQQLQEMQLVVRGSGTNFTGKHINFEVRQNGPVMPSIPGMDVMTSPPAANATMTIF